MDQYHADLAWLENPEVFAVNRLEAHSDHRFYESREEADGGIMKLRQSLNGTWKFSYAPKPEQRKRIFICLREVSVILEKSRSPAI